MKYSLCIAALISVALAVTHEEHQAFIRRQSNVQNSVSANVPAMTDQNGNVVPFDASKVYMAGQAAGL
ncbi:uncharacterized protein SPSK_11026 [Sporothrix schenckii 1099-18]|uniref:Uncharacterized protein n=3 Tax=Sporothrix TaxID=29907 RepID=U7PLQ4_SPOS1|nr:uncharacterized protein SPSK_11026 [Sporothrix schenckii 1099-18]XP_040621435.1 uncharacterized protein SPBR_04515 [Sporothrix brasiliensis 5110]ERS95420.1 hypothetical protein HMPREF1624_08298 [Sporothrix schenckii ATCC 58251]KIH93425.1 hypothetical protein SPBR_04515 [Sporothrix brasiliensis 5110]KJR87450.1 hypothetical protein SPSK_11026 [Sporothrix schenckii 1099-18]